MHRVVIEMSDAGQMRISMNPPNHDKLLAMLVLAQAQVIDAMLDKSKPQGVLVAPGPLPQETK